LNITRPGTDTLKPNVGHIAAVVETAQAGEVTRVDVGRFTRAPTQQFTSAIAQTPWTGSLAT
jgi:hypothetical protein